MHPGITGLDAILADVFVRLLNLDVIKVRAFGHVPLH